MWEIKKNMMQAVQVGTLLVCIFLTHCIDVGRGCLECHHVGWDVVRFTHGLHCCVLFAGDDITCGS
jgi:hypothetical protein